MANLEKKLRTRIAQKWDLAENWVRSELQLLKGELAIDELNRIKIGNGVDKWRDLPFAVDGKSTAISFLNELPEAASSDFKPGNLVLTPDNKLWCLVATGTGDNAVRSWVDLTNKADIEELQTSVSGLESGIVTLKTQMDAKDAEHDSAVVSLATGIEEVKATAKANSDVIGVIYDSRNGKINSSALPAFVDDIMEGLIAINNVPEDVTYSLTHDENGKIVGFFGVGFGDESGATKTLKLITAGTPDNSINLSGVTTTISGITYNFDAVSAKIPPSTSIIYVDVMTSKSYRWSGTQFVAIAGDLALGITSGSAFYGDRGLAVEQEVFGTEDQENPKTGLVERVGTLETDLAAEIAAREEADANEAAARAEADALEAQARIDGDKANESAIVALAAECEINHKAIRDEFSASIIALKENSERADAAHDASFVMLKERIDALNVTTNSMSINEVISNSTPSQESGCINDEVLVIDCGGADAPALDPEVDPEVGG